MNVTTISLDDLSLVKLDKEVNEAVDEIELIACSFPPREACVEDLAKRTLSPDINRSLPDVDLVVKEFGIEIESDGFRINIYGRDISLVVVLATTVALLISWLS